MLGPIFYRELLTIPRRGRHYVIRSMYLFVLWVLALTLWQAAFGWGRETSLGDLAHFGALLFQLLSFLQLTLVIFFSALLAASAVTQEKDHRTFLLLLMTDLSNSEVVLGKLFGSLLQIGALVAGALPVLAFTMLLGGVAFQQVMLAFLILAASALAAGSLGCLLALWREKTFQTLALTVLALVLFLLLIEGLSLITVLQAHGWLPVRVDADVIYVWQARLNPYRALQSVVEPTSEAALAGTSAYDFTGVMLGLSLLLNALAVWKLRVWNPGSETIQQREDTEEDAERHVHKVVNVHAAPGKLRPVWVNPVLWREIRTRGYGRRPLIVKAAYGLVFAMILFGVYRGIQDASLADRLFPAWGLVPIVVLSLLLLNAQAVTSITSERDGKSLDILLVTDLSPREFIFGKLGGIFYNTKEIVLPPLLLAGFYGWWGFIGWETLLYVFIALLVLMAFTGALGLHVALRTVSSRTAIGYSLGTIFFLFVGTLICIYLIVVSGRFETQWTSFIFFLAIGIGGLWLILAGNKPSTALFIAAWACPLAIFYTVTHILIGDPHHAAKSGDPLIPFLVLTSAFGFTVAAMLIPHLSEFDVAHGYSGPAEE